MKKRVFSMLLALVMALSLLPTMAVAEGEPSSLDVTKNDVTLENHCTASTVTVGAGKTLIIKGKIELKVTKELTNSGTIVGEQDAQIIVSANATVSGVTFYDESGQTPWPTVFSQDETFIWIAKDDKGSEMNKWVHYANNAGPGGDQGDGGGGDHGGDDGGDQGDGGGGQGGGQGEQGNPQSTNWAALKSEIKNYTFAYGPASDSVQSEQDMLKKGIAAELYARKMGNGPDSSDTTLGMALGYDPEHGDDMSTAEKAIADMITITGDGTETDADVADLHYYTFNLVVPGNQETTEITEGFTIEKLRVYVLKSDKEFLLKTASGGKTTYTIVPCAGYKDDKQLGDSGCEELDRFVYAPFDVDDPAIEAYGNGIFLNNAISEDGSVFGFHAACEHCGSIGKINCRLIVSSAENSIQISSTDDAAAWNFINVGVYEAAGTEEVPVNATIFFGSRTISFRTATGSKTVTNVEAVGLPDGAVTFEDGTLTFKTNYDEVLVKVTYGTGKSATEGYMLLHRVGLSISKTDNTNDGFVTGHGSDHFVRYPSAGAGKDKVVYATFYYDDNHSAADGESKATAVKSHYDSISDKVSLFVTITKNDGTVTTQVISTPVTYADGAYVAENGGIEHDRNENNVIGYAGQGSNHFYDDFVLWSGSESDYMNIASVSAIVYTPGANDDSFGGVKVGSGTGVQWTKQR